MLSLDEAQRALILKKLAPLGRVPRYDAEAQTVTLSETSARRFIIDGTACTQRPRSIALQDPKAYDPSYLGFGIHEALSVLIQDDYALYATLFDTVRQIDSTASTMFGSCEQAALILSHNSFGEELFPHVHARSMMDTQTLSLFVNLTGTDSATLTLFDPVTEDSRVFKNGYTDHRVVAVHARKADQREIKIEHGSFILFDAAKTPHKFSYSDDIWLTFVYDHVNGVREDVRANSL
jgi:hypothetical protein